MIAYLKGTVLEKGRDHVVILSHAFWESRYAANPDILQRTIKLEGQDYQVVGVMPNDFEYPPGSQVLIPAAFSNPASCLIACGLPRSRPRPS